MIPKSFSRSLRKFSRSGVGGGGGSVAGIFTGKNPPGMTDGGKDVLVMATAWRESVETRDVLQLQDSVQPNYTKVSITKTGVKCNVQEMRV